MYWCYRHLNISILSTLEYALWFSARSTNGQWISIFWKLSVPYEVLISAWYINNIITMFLVNIYLRTLQLNWCMYIIEVRHLKIDSAWFLHSQLFMVDLTSENNYSSWAVMVVRDSARRWSTVGSSAASLPSSTSTIRYDFSLTCTIECHCFYYGIQHLQLWLKWEFWSW